MKRSSMPPRQKPLRRTSLTANGDRALARLTRTRRLKARPHPEKDPIRAAVFDRDGHRCQLADFACSGPLDFHHVRKAGAGGAYVAANGKTLCRFHNDDLEDRPWLYAGTGLVVREGDPEWESLGLRAARNGEED